MNGGFDYREQIGAAADGWTVLDHLVRRYRHSSEEEWRGRIEAGHVLLEGRSAGAATRLRAGQTLIWRRPPWREPDAPRFWGLLFRDRALLAVAKPAGLPTLPGGGFLEHTLLMLARRRFPEAVPLHRLDRGASGIVLLARTAAARDRLAEAFRRGEVEKRYKALVDGIMEPDWMRIDRPITRLPHPSLGEVYAAGESSGRSARTEVRVVQRRESETLVEVMPQTGRPHQIRIHLAAAGHPLAGDRFYAAGGLLRDAARRPGEGGYLLHAERLAFAHPETGKTVKIECQPPRDLRGAMRS